MVRLFLAINLPAEIKRRLKALQEELARSGAEVRWVRPEGLHLTLKFFGNVPEEMVDRLAQVTEEVVKQGGYGPFDLRVKGLGTFPPNRRARVVWAGLEGDLASLIKLQQSLEKAFSRLGFEPEKRPFVPHVTLGRVKSPRGIERLLKRLTAHREETFSSPIKVTELILYQSILKPSGAVYTPRKRISLV